MNTIGARPPYITSVRKAASSSVSVPCVTTTPSLSVAAPTAARAVVSASSSETWALGRVEIVRARTDPGRTPGTPSSSAAASSAGSGPRAFIAIVPPVASRVTIPRRS